MHRSLRWLKRLTCVLGAFMLFLCLFVVPSLAGETAASNPEYAAWKVPVMVFIYITAVPFFLALHQTLRLCSYVEKREPFSGKSAAALGKIEICALCEILLYVAGAALLAGFDLLHPGLLIIILIILLSAGLIALICGVLVGLVRSAVKMKEENELTI